MSSARSAANHGARSGSRPSSGEAESASEIGRGEPYQMTELSVEAINNKEKNMPTINERQRKNAPSTWQATVRVKGHPSVSQTFDTREEAERFGLEAERASRSKATRIAREHSALRKANPALADFMQEKLCDTLAAFAKSPRATPRHDTILPTIVANIGQVRIGEIRRSWIDAYLAKMSNKKSRKGANFKWGTLAAHMIVMGTAIRWRAESQDLPPPPLPFSTKLLPDGWEVSRERRLEAGEEQALMTATRKSLSPAKYHWRLMIRLALETGARLQELVRSEWREFETGRRLWTIPAAHTKTKRERAVPLSKKALRVLRLLEVLRKPGDSRPFHTIANARAASQAFKAISKKAGTVDFRFHDLRHEAISRMVLYKRQLSVFEIMRIVGHSNAEMLHRYANLRGDEMSDRME
jgi:integrase